VDTVRASSDGEEVEIAYADLPGFPPPTVAGHAGRLWIGSVGDRGLAIFQGRVHFYEGHGMALASITSRLSAELGARAMVLTAATGALDPEIEAGTLVVLRDHLNLMGENPLHGWRFPDGSPAFVDVSQVYDPDL
jgi:purine-nucleoside phosphorylase